MTADKLTNALIALLTPTSPGGIPVVDARSQQEKRLPQIAVSIEQPDRHSAALPGVQKCPVTITLEAHPGDGVDRATLTAWANSIEKTLNEPAAMKLAITSSTQGIQCDHWAYDGGYSDWEESTFQAKFSAEAWVVRTS